jgi:hypothetical protein
VVIFSVTEHPGGKAIGSRPAKALRNAHCAKLTRRTFFAAMARSRKGDRWAISIGFEANRIKEGKMNKKASILWVMIAGMAFLLACAGPRAVSTTSPAENLPLSVEFLGMERLNPIAAKPPYGKTDTLVFRASFKIVNPNQVWAKVEDFYFEAKVEDGTPEKTIVLTGSIPGGVIPARGEMTLSCTEPYIYGGVFGSYILRGVGGEKGIKGAAKKLEELWKDLGNDKRKFYISGKIASSLPEFSGLGIVHRQFNAEFTIPTL